MAYQADLGTDQTLTVQQQGEQTLIHFQNKGQAQSVGTQTGTWTQAPRLYRTGDGTVLEIQAEERMFYTVQDGQLQSLDSAPDLSGLESAEFRQVADRSGRDQMKPVEKMRPMTPMEPIKPMKPM